MGREDTGKSVTLLIDGSGAYTAPSLRPAAYSVQAEAFGFMLAKARAVLRAGEVLQLDLQQLSPVWLEPISRPGLRSRQVKAASLHQPVHANPRTGRHLALR